MRATSLNSVVFPDIGGPISNVDNNVPRSSTITGLSAFALPIADRAIRMLTDPISRMVFTNPRSSTTARPAIPTRWPPAMVI